MSTIVCATRGVFLDGARAEHWESTDGRAGWVIVSLDGARLDADSWEPYRPTARQAWAAVGGRPERPQPVPLTIRATPAERARWQAAARAEGLTLSEWVRRRLG